MICRTRMGSAYAATGGREHSGAACILGPMPSTTPLASVARSIMRYVERAESRNRKPGIDRPGELLQPVAVPAVRIGSAILREVFKKVVDDGCHFGALIRHLTHHHPKWITNLQLCLHDLSESQDG